MLKGLMWFAVIALVSALGWKTLRSSTAQPAAPPSAPFVFDNGTVREQPVPQKPKPRVAGAVPGIRKCKHGDSVTYTDGECPRGAKEHGLTGGAMTVIDGGVVQPSPQASEQPSGARKTLHDALDLSGGENLRQKAIERAVDRGAGQ